MENDLDVSWSDIDGVGLVRVEPIFGFHEGVEKLVLIAAAAEEFGIEPEVTLNSEELTITLGEDTDGRYHKFAHKLDILLG